MPPAVATPAYLCSSHCSSHCADKEPSPKNGKIPNRAWPRRLRLVRKAPTVVCILTHWLLTISRRNFRSISLSGAIYSGGVFKQQGSKQTTNFAVSTMRTKVSACDGAKTGESFVRNPACPIVPRRLSGWPDQLCSAWFDAAAPTNPCSNQVFFGPGDGTIICDGGCTSAECCTWRK